MKKSLLVLMAVALCFAMTLVFTSCGKGGDAVNADDISKITGETVDMTSFTALCPEGWNNNSDSYFFKIAKDSKQIVIQYNATKMTIPEDAVKESYIINGETWEGGKPGGGKNLVFTKEINGKHLTIQCYDCNPKEVDVAAVLASVSVK